MINCNECGKKLGLFEGYRHPILGKKYLLCSPCFDQVSENVKRWGDFVISNPYFIKSLNNNLNWGKIASGFNKIQKKNPNVLYGACNRIIFDENEKMMIKDILMNFN